MEKKREYIDNLLTNIKSLEEKFLAVKDEGAIPFSFFREAYNRTETIMRLLHELENLQIDEMRTQMEKLIALLSEAENNKHAVAKTVEKSEVKENRGETVKTAFSLNDVIPTKPATLDLIKSISLNDRFLFQRELFNNDREAMHAMMEKLNTFENYEDAEAYLRGNTSWNFEDQTVKDFLYVIKKGFE